MQRERDTAFRTKINFGLAVLYFQICSLGMYPKGKKVYGIYVAVSLRSSLDFVSKIPIQKITLTAAYFLYPSYYTCINIYQV